MNNTASTSNNTLTGGRSILVLNLALAAFALAAHGLSFSAWMPRVATEVFFFDVPLAAFAMSLVSNLVFRERLNIRDRQLLRVCLLFTAVLVISLVIAAVTSNSHIGVSVARDLVR